MDKSSPGLIDYLRSGTRIQFLFRRRTILRPYLFLFDAMVVFAAFLLAYALRFGFELSSIGLGLCLLQSLPVLFIYLGFEAAFKSFAGLPKPTVFQNIVGVIMSATASLAVLWLIALFSPDEGWFGPWSRIPASILVLHYLLSMFFLILIRLCCRTKI